MIPNNNFYGKKHGKTIRDFSLGLDYKIDNILDRVEFTKERLEIKNENGIECTHEFFVDLFDQTFDTQIDKDGLYWVVEENKYMHGEEFKKWAISNGIDIVDYLDIQTAFDVIEYEDSDQVERGSWNYSKVNTSSVKLLLNSTDAQYTEGNIAKEISKMADYILAKDKREKDKVKVYIEKDFVKRLILEKQKLEGLEKVNDDEFAVLKRVKNYRLAPSMEIHKSDYKLPVVYRGSYEDYVEHWESHQFIVKYIDGKYKRVFIDKDSNLKSRSVQMTETQWIRGKRDRLEKISLLEEANKNAIYIKESMEALKVGEQKSKMTLSQLKKNMGSVKEYMNMVKTSYDNYVCISPDKCPQNSSLMDIIDYSNNKHIEVIMSLSDDEKSISSDMSILAYDVNKAIDTAYSHGALGELDMNIIKLLKRGCTKKDIAQKISYSRVTVHKKVENIIGVIQEFLNEK